MKKTIEEKKLERIKGHLENDTWKDQRSLRKRQWDEQKSEKMVCYLKRWHIFNRRSSVQPSSWDLTLKSRCNRAAPRNTTTTSSKISFRLHRFRRGTKSGAISIALRIMCEKRYIHRQILRKTLSRKKHNICHWCKNTQRWRILEHELLGQVSWRDIPRVHHEEHADQGCILQSALLIYEEKQEVTCH